LVGQGAATGNSFGLSGTVNGQPRIFVGDSRPLQVLFREGLLYVTRVAQIFDLNNNSLGTSTVMYDIIKQVGPTCQVNGSLGLGAAGPFCIPPATALCNADPTATGCTPSPYSTFGQTIPNPVTILETYWYNGNTPSPCP